MAPGRHIRDRITSKKEKKITSEREFASTLLILRYEILTPETSPKTGKFKPSQTLDAVKHILRFTFTNKIVFFWVFSY